MDDQLPGGVEGPEQEASGATSWMANAAILMMFATLMSAVTGLLRESAISYRFGSGHVTDAFYNALTIPDFLYFLVAGGALRTGFVPVFTELMARGKTERAWRTFSALFWLLAMVSAVLAGAGILLAEPLAHLVNPSWAGESSPPVVRAILLSLGLMEPGQVGAPEPVQLCAAIMRLLFPAQVFFLLGGLLMGALNAEKHFLWPAMGPIIYNVAIIAAALVAPWLLGPSTLGWGALIGAAVGNFAVQMLALRARGGRLMLAFSITPGVRRVILLALPVMLGLAIAEINFVVTKVLANSVDPEGGVSILNWGNRLWKLPSRVIGAGIAIALFPALAEHYARGACEQFRKDFSFGIRNVVFLTLPATVLIMVLAEPSVNLLFALAPETARAVAVTLLWFSAGIVPLGLVYVAARAFYARHDMMTPVWIGAISVAACVVAAVLLSRPYNVAGLAMATSISGIVNAALLLVLLQVRVGGLGGREIARSLLRMIPANAVMGVITWGALWATRRVLADRAISGGLEELLLVVVPMAFGALAFMGVARAMHLRELESAWRMVARRIGRRR